MAPMPMRVQGGSPVNYGPGAGMRRMPAEAQAQVPYYYQQRADARSEDNQSSIASAIEENPLAGRPPPSSTVHGFVNHINQYETRCQFLEERNLWLTKKLMDCQRNFIERTLASGPKQILRKSFKGWIATLAEMRLERQLHEQTASLDQCQHLARELGAALTDEQGARAATDMQHRTAQKQLEEANMEGQRLSEEYQSGSGYLESLQRLVREAEGCLNRARVEAMTVVEHANRYEARVKELSYEAKDRKQRVVRPGGDDALEYANSKRDEAHEVMHKVSHLLPARHSNPEDERM